MKYMKLIIAIFLPSIILASCSGNSAVKTGKDNAQDNASTENSSSAGSGSFSATIDGKTISGGEVDDLQLTNTAFLYPDGNDKNKILLFDLASDKNGEDFYSLRFYVYNKEGEQTITSNNGSERKTFVRLGFNLKSADNFAIYNGDSLIVTINKITSSRVSGTFSGSFTLSNDSRSKPYKSPVIVTDGKFDIPFSTGNLRPI